MIHTLPDGTFVISSHGTWLPGAYASERAARYAFRMSTRLLARLERAIEGGKCVAITFEMLQAARGPVMTEEDEEDAYLRAMQALRADAEETIMQQRIGQAFGTRKYPRIRTRRGRRHFYQVFGEFRTKRAAFRLARKIRDKQKYTASALVVFPSNDGRRWCVGTHRMPRQHGIDGVRRK